MPPRKPVRSFIEPKEESKTIPLNVSGKKKKETNRTQSSSAGGFKQLGIFLRDERLHFILGLATFLVLIYLSIGMISYFFTGAEDQSKMELSLGELHEMRNDIQNVTSVGGAYISHLLIHKSFGIGAFTLLIFGGVLAFRLMKKKLCSIWKAFFHCGFWLIWLSITLGFIDIWFQPATFFLLGGEHGVYVSEWIISYIGELGLILALGGSVLIYSIITSVKTIPFLRNLFSKNKNAASAVVTEDLEENDENDNEPTVAVGTEIVPEEWIMGSNDKLNDEEEDVDIKEDLNDDVTFEIEKPVEEEENKPVDIAEMSNKSEENDDPFYNLDKLGQYDPTLDLSRYVYPTLSLLKVYGTDNETQIDMKEQNANKERITSTLQNYGIEIKTIKATVGPTITLYEIVPKEGVRISKIRNLEYDIMLSLAATGIRIIAPIPGKGTIGIEVPNADPQVVSMHSIIA
ncbi:MAG: DNA translocase FtsK 4TM domain-containing protein, partial [Paludibacter sp.]|nr:DNA translocase FtsK 4TM domain-containing protein [Paludibacter sp.]